LPTEQIKWKRFNTCKGALVSITPPSNNLPGVNPSLPTRSGPPVPTPILIQGEPKKASIIPLLVASLLLLLSAAIYLLRYQLDGALIWYVIGYTLTPLLMSLALGWDSVLQRQGRKDPWFEAKPSYSRIIRLLVALGFIVAIFHIIEIGTICGQGFVQSGVFCGS
jgi:hypothetical protein